MNELTPGAVEFLAELRARDVQTRDRIEMLKDGRLGLRGQTSSGGWEDLTHEAIAFDEAMLATNAKIYAEWDPDGLTG